MRQIVFCTTCKYSETSKTGPDGRTGGEMLIAEMKAYLKANGREDIEVAEQECLWSCRRHCNVLLRDTDKFSYLTGDFEPGADAPSAIIDWFDKHGQSELGTVSFREWPDGMRGHFIARIPPAPIG